MAEARQGGEPRLREPLPALEGEPAAAEPAAPELSIEPLEPKLAAPDRARITDPVDPANDLSHASPDSGSDATPSIPGATADFVAVPPALPMAEVSSAPMPDATLRFTPGDAPAPSMAPDPGIRTDQVLGSDMSKATPSAQMPSPSAVQQSTVTAKMAAGKEDASPRYKEISPKIAREILGATVKRVPNMRLKVLGSLATLVLALYLAFYFHAFDRFFAQPSLGLQPSAPAQSAVAAPVAAVAATPSAPGAPEVPSVPGAPGAAADKAASRSDSPGRERSAKMAKGDATPRPAVVQPIADGGSAALAGSGRAKPAKPVVTSRPPPPGDLELAYAALTEGRLDEAKVSYGKVLQKNSAERDALLGLAYIAQRQGSNEEARNYYQQVLRLEPGHAGANAGMLAIAAEGDLSQAASRAREMVERMPDSAAALSTLANILAREGRIAEAQQAYFKALTIEPENALHAYNLAVALDRLHKYSLARTYYQRALALAEKSNASDRSGVPLAEAERRLEQLRTLGGERSTATIPSSSAK
ncbi:MAG: tetratricopeptide repeat protein [Rhodocyclales bacterium]|nr:tetratricopeptide repeat protein [Rhodocyclales bacterium]